MEDRIRLLKQTGLRPEAGGRRTAALPRVSLPLALTSAHRYEHAPLVGHAPKLLRAPILEGETAPRDEILHCLRNEDFGGANQPRRSVRRSQLRGRRPC